MTVLIQTDLNLEAQMNALFPGRPARTNKRAELDPKFIQLKFDLTFDGAHDDRDNRGSAQKSHARRLVA